MKRFAFALVAVLSFAGFLAFSHTPGHSARSPLPSVASTQVKTTAFMSDVHIRQYNRDGKLVRKLSTPHSTTLSDNKLKTYTVIRKPRMIVFDSSQGHVNIRADHGRLTDHDRTLLLTQHVQIRQQKEHSGPPLRLSTQRLTVYPERQLAETTALVYIKQGPQLSLQARGLTAWLDKNLLQLHKPVRGYYVPELSKTQVQPHAARSAAAHERSAL